MDGMTLSDIVYAAERRARQGANNLASLARMVMTYDYSLEGAQNAAEQLWRGGVDSVSNMRRAQKELPDNYRRVQDKLYELRRR